MNITENILIDFNKRVVENAMNFKMSFVGTNNRQVPLMSIDSAVRETWFKVAMKVKDTEPNFETVYVITNLGASLIHRMYIVNKLNNVKVCSLYYDEDRLLGYEEYPYVEAYDNFDTARFYPHEDDWEGKLLEYIELVIL